MKKQILSILLIFLAVPALQAAEAGEDELKGLAAEAEDMVHLSLSIMIKDCAICISGLKDPISLPCHHQFCTKCLLRHIYTQAQARHLPDCPECRGSIVVAEERVAAAQAPAGAIARAAEAAPRAPAGFVEEGVVAALQERLQQERIWHENRYERLRGGWAVQLPEQQAPQADHLNDSLDFDYELGFGVVCAGGGIGSFALVSRNSHPLNNLIFTSLCAALTHNAFKSLAACFIANPLPAREKVQRTTAFIKRHNVAVGALASIAMWKLGNKALETYMKKK